MLPYPNIDPVALAIGPLAIHWYGLMYLIGIVAGWALLVQRVKHKPSGFTTNEISDIIFYAALGIILGGRLGYMLFYSWADLQQNPFSLFAVWQGGMSFHGGLLGVIIALWMYAKKTKRTLFQLTDLIAPVVPIGLGAGRIGNFINGELWGKTTTLPWGMIFPTGGPLPRHPSQLYEFFLEGVIMFCILWFYSNKERPRGAVSALFLICYGLFRFSVEFFRMPDAQIGYLAFGWLTEGQLLSIPMIIIGIVLFLWINRGRQPCNNI